MGAKEHGLAGGKEVGEGGVGVRIGDPGFEGGGRGCSEGSCGEGGEVTVQVGYVRYAAKLIPWLTYGSIDAPWKDL